MQHTTVPALFVGQFMRGTGIVEERVLNMGGFARVVRGNTKANHAHFRWNNAHARSRAV